MEFAKNCGYNLFHCDVNHYHQLCPREKYFPRIQELLKSFPLLPTTYDTTTIIKKSNWITDRCEKAHSKPYMDQKGWRGDPDWFKEGL